MHPAMVDAPIDPQGCVFSREVNSVEAFPRRRRLQELRDTSAVHDLPVVARGEDRRAAQRMRSVVAGGGRFQCLVVGGARRCERGPHARGSTIRGRGANVRDRVGLTAVRNFRQATVQTSGSDWTATLRTGYGADRAPNQTLAAGVRALCVRKVDLHWATGAAGVGVLDQEGGAIGIPGFHFLDWEVRIDLRDILRAATPRGAGAQAGRQHGEGGPGAPHRQTVALASVHERRRDARVRHRSLALRF